MNWVHYAYGAFGEWSLKAALGREASPTTLPGFARVRRAPSFDVRTDRALIAIPRPSIRWVDNDSGKYVGDVDFSNTGSGPYTRR